MITKSDFQAAIAASISSYPTAAMLYRAQDPILLSQLDAMATMLAMLSAEQDIAAAEPFTKARDVTVLADAAVKGILPFGTPARMVIAIQNKNLTPVTVLAGRKLLDTQGRAYVTDIGATIAGETTGQITVTQSDFIEYPHTVALSQPFYKIPLTKPDALISSVQLFDSGLTEFLYHKDFVNVGDGDTVFHIESDENRNLNIVFGMTGVAGYQPAAGEVFTVRINTTSGYFELALGSPFSFDTSSLYDGNLALSLLEIIDIGANPMSVSTLREVCSYPSIYDTSSVYLGNFDFLIRRNIQNLRFLSVWNEQKEEAVRGANLDNINKLFVSARKDGITDSALFDQIAVIIESADDSYKPEMIAIDVQEIPVEITAYLAAIYDSAEIEAAIREVVAAEYGPDSAFAKRGSGRVNKKRLNILLSKSIAALQDPLSDLDISVTDPVIDILPENYRYVSSSSLTVIIEGV